MEPGDGTWSEHHPSPRIDLRSDVLSPPTPAMFEAMERARIGWSLHQEDPSVLRLEAIAATTLGVEAALFLPNATTANLLALLVQGERGTGVVMDVTSHVNVVEWYGLALGGMIPRTVPSQGGHLAVADVEEALSDGMGGRAPHTSVVVLENTHTFAGGVVIPVQESDDVANVAHRHGAAVHLDGARLFDAAVALGTPVATLTRSVDTVAVSLSKGLCAPYGGILGGSRPIVDRARTLSLQIGFGRIHKSGYFAAAGIIALESMVDRLVDDHRRARRIGEALARMPGLQVNLDTVQTNLVLARLAGPEDPETLVGRLRELGVGLMAMPDRQIRAVVHRGIGDEDITDAIRIIESVLG